MSSGRYFDFARKGAKTVWLHGHELGWSSNFRQHLEELQDRFPKAQLLERSLFEQSWVHIQLSQKNYPLRYNVAERKLRTWQSKIDWCHRWGAQ